MDEIDNLKALARARSDGDLKAEVDALRRLLFPEKAMAANINAQMAKLSGTLK